MTNAFPGPNHRILIIDDNRAIHEDFRKILHQVSPDRDVLDAAEESLFGLTPRRAKMPAYELVSAYQGRDGAVLAAEALAAGQPFAMAFVDMRMPPGWDGLETIEKLWEQQPDLQIVLCTAHSDYSLEEILDRVDVSDRLLILKKPFDTVEALQFANALTEKWRLGKTSLLATSDLQRMVAERTASLEQANTRLREQAQLIDLAQDAISVCDLEGRVQSWNRGAEKIFGYGAAEAVSECIMKLVYGLDRRSYEKAFDATLANGEWSGELHLQTKAGAKVVVNSRWTLLRDEAGAPKLILVIGSDITEHKNLESQFLRAQRLESIGTLASGVAHDLNNILAPILVAVPLLRYDNLPAKSRETFLSTIEISAQRGADIVRQVLTFARGVEGERLLLLPTHLLKEIGRILEETFPKDIHISVDYHWEIWPLEGDPTQLHQVLLNLCVNARDAMPDGGNLTLSAENLEVDEHLAAMMPGAKPGPHVVIQARDTGSGIPQEVIDRIFDPFFTTKEMGKGTGLGLSTTVGIVKSHGGFINVKSEVGHGATFRIYLPASPGAKQGVSKDEEAAPPAANGELLLIVDDERGIREISQLVLERHGYRVVVAADGPEALAIFAQRMDEIQLVLTDLMMPFMDGVTLIRTLRKMRPNVPIIAATGRTDDRRLQELAALDVPVCLEKPYTNQKLLATLRDTLSGVGMK